MKMLLNICVFCFRDESKKVFESDSRKGKVQPLLLPNSWIHIFPIFLIEWLEIEVFYFNFGRGRAC